MTKEPIGEVIVRIDENVKSMQIAFDQHINRDERLLHDIIKPLWEKHQQDIGAEKTKNYGGVLVGFAINASIAVAAAWAAVKGLSK